MVRPNTERPAATMMAFDTLVHAWAMNGTVSNGKGKNVNPRNEKTKRNATRLAKVQRGTSARSDSACAAAGSGSAKLDADILRLREKPQRLESAFAADAALFHAAERHAQIAQEPAV